MTLLKQSTATDVELGVFVSDTDFKTPQTSLTLTQSDCQLIKNGGATAQKNDATSATHRGGGHYSIPLNTTDSAILGRLRLYVNKSGSLPVWRDFQVVPANVHDALVGLHASDVLQIDVAQWNNAAVATPDTAGYPKTTLKAGTGTGEVSLSSGTVTVGTNNDKTGYTASTVSDKTGYSLAADQSGVTIGTVTTATTATNLTNAPTVGDLTSTMKTSVQTAANAALEAQDLDHLAKVTYGATKPTDGSLFDQIMNKDGSQTFSSGTDSLEGLVDNAATVQNIWDNTTRTLTAPTNLTSTDGEIQLHTDNKVLLAGTTHTSAVIPTVTTLTTWNSISLKKNTEYASFMFVMRDSTNHAPATGKTITATRIIDSGSEASCTNSAAEVGTTCVYRITLSTTDLNGDSVMFKFAATACDDLFVHVRTQS